MARSHRFFTVTQLTSTKTNCFFHGADSKPIFKNCKSFGRTLIAEFRNVESSSQILVELTHLEIKEACLLHIALPHERGLSLELAPALALI